ncbi:hypothetical protein PTSG_11057 [Salpingoeca rosetta]|uniref:EGF-like domain-containing protein n=1 Tax=Salpingoeca rosetta (strain ATCC 50818 / BSB-021) TaxID=946362 RepID=F2US07_SALR5|nr:uncharacterized protein PTSG_11057 [Salpingoeca rosetta]EGD80412.1 hypothetical protein PTSG_11057 [Salpingoeca rosetta]|eukprot:XP_004987976.1 hypothetical protein PTSG_11057 [Salpingoeca rosetta]
MLVRVLAVVVACVVSTTLAELPFVNEYHETLNMECTGSTGIKSLYSTHQDNKKDRRWGFECLKYGAPEEGTSMYSSSFENNYDDPLDYSCPNNYYVYRMYSEYDGNPDDRVWKIGCRKAVGATLSSCSFTDDYINSWGKPIDYSVDRLYSVHNDRDEDRRWRIRTCTLDCDESSGYIEDDTSDWGCTVVTCPPLTLTNGVLSGSCDGDFGDQCSFSSCNSGYEVSASGTKGARQCGIVSKNGVWSGSAPTCDDINECVTGAHECVAPAVCVNDDGSYHCECDYGPLSSDGKSCDLAGPKATYTLNSHSFELAITDADEFPTYEVTVAQWSLDLSQATELPGYPVQYTSPLTNFEASDLQPGRRFQVTITPYDSDDAAATDYVFVGGTSAGDLRTTCGCLSGDTTGAPSSLELSQERGIVEFTFTDQSYCESGFNFFRDGISMSSSYDVTSEVECGTTHNPQLVYDDLTLQKEDIYKPLDEGTNHDLPEGTFFLLLHTGSSEGDKRFAFPWELAIGEHFTSTSTSSSTSQSTSTSTSTSTQTTTTTTTTTQATTTTLNLATLNDTFIASTTSTLPATTTTTVADDSDASADAATAPSTGRVERVYPSGIESAVTSKQECFDLCEDRSEWCIAFVVQEDLSGQLWCHQLKLIRTTKLDGNDVSADSYERVTVSDTGVSGSYLLATGIDACTELCSESSSCEIVFAGDGFCAMANTMQTTSVSPSSYHESLIIRSQKHRYVGSAPGSYKQYCVAATNPIDYTALGYYSTRTCADLQIEWETFVRGRILVDSGSIDLAVEDVRVDISIGTKYSTTRFTDEDGYFEVLVSSPDLYDIRQTMTLSFSKTSGEVGHTFSCGGMACTEMTLQVEHLRFDYEVEVRDTTSVPFSGRVTIQGTEHQGYPDGCPLRDVEVCLYDRIDGGKELVCATTDSQGYYTAAAVIGSSVYVIVSYGNSSHSFQRLEYTSGAPNAPSGFYIGTDTSSGLDTRIPYYDVLDGKEWKDVDFQDTTVDTVVVDVAGGLCNRTLGRSVLEFRYDNCPTWVHTEQTSSRTSTWTLPAQIITVRLARVVRSGEVREEITRYFSSTLGTSRSQYADLRNAEDSEDDETTVRFEYHPQPTLSVSFTPTVAHSCSYSDDTDFIVMQQRTETIATVKAIEEFGAGVASCDIVEGSVTVQNLLGESPTTANQAVGVTVTQRELLQVCYSECELDLDLDEVVTAAGTEQSNAHATLRLLTGGPELNSEAVDPEHPYTKQFRVSMQVLPYDPVILYKKVVVTGHQARGASGSVPFPRYKPLLVVQDPPGGLSTASYSSMFANFRFHSKTYEAFGGFQLGVDVAPYKTEAELDLCTGAIAAYNCINLVSVKSTPYTFQTKTTNLFGGQSPDDNFNREQVWSFTIDVTTSDEPMIAGEQSDMFLVPALNVVFLDTDVISFNTTTCSVNRSLTTTWSLDPEANEQVMTWLSVFEIESKELPELEERLEATIASIAEAEASDDDDGDNLADLQQLKDELELAISAWNDNLQRNRNVRNSAASGTLEKVQSLWTAGKYLSNENANPIQGKVNRRIAFAPNDSIDNAKNLDGTDTTGEDQATLREISAIKFAGGGSLYSFSFDYSNHKSAVSSSKSKHNFEGGGTVSFDVSSSTGGADFSVTALGLTEVETSRETEEGYAKESSAGFELGDADPLDVFDVEVYVHPDFGTLVFHTTSGQSSCPPENNTIALENPRISILKQPAAPVLPNEPAVFELLLTNDGPVATDFNLFNLNSENQDGLTIMVDGHPLTHPIDFEGFAVGARHVTISLLRGPSLYSYDPVAVGWRSLCEADRHPDNGYTTDEVTTVQYVYLEAEFLQPCSPVELVGSIGETETFEVNQAVDEQTSHPGELRIVAFNSDFASRKWTEDDRLEGVYVEYKPAASSVWLLARDIDGNTLDVRLMENEYGYVTTYWDVSGITDGDYELRIRAQCTASINEVPDGIDEQYSSTATGVIDRSAPQVLGYPEPADGEYSPGDEIAFEFDEDVQCAKPFWFEVQMTIDGLDEVFANDDMVMVCEGRRITMSLVRGFAWDDVSGRSARVTLNSVQDPYGNVASQEFVLEFQFALVAAEALTTQLTGIELPLPFEDAFFNTKSPEYQNVTARIEADIANATGIVVTRVRVASLAPTDLFDYDAGITVSVYLLPEDTATRRRRRRDGLPSLSPSRAAQFFNNILINGTANLGRNSLFFNVSTLGRPEMMVLTSNRNGNSIDTTSTTSQPSTSTGETVDSGASSSKLENMTELNTNLSYAILVLVLVVIVLEVQRIVYSFRKHTYAVKEPPMVVAHQAQASRASFELHGGRSTSSYGRPFYDDFDGETTTTMSHV